MTKDTEEAEICKVFFASVFTSKTIHKQYEAPETSGKLWNKEYSFLVKEDQVRKHLNKSDIH